MNNAAVFMNSGAKLTNNGAKFMSNGTKLPNIGAKSTNIGTLFINIAAKCTNNGAMFGNIGSLLGSIALLFLGFVARLCKADTVLSGFWTKRAVLGSELPHAGAGV